VRRGTSVVKPTTVHPGFNRGGQARVRDFELMPARNLRIRSTVLLVPSLPEPVVRIDEFIQLPAYLQHFRIRERMGLCHLIQSLAQGFNLSQYVFRCGFHANSLCRKEKGYASHPAAAPMHRLEFKPSERVEIARRIEESLAGRQGNPTGANQYVPAKSEDEGNTQNFAEFHKGESRDIAAKSVGLNRETYRQAKSVVDSGRQDVVEQMDKGDLSIHAAYEQVRREAAGEYKIVPREFAKCGSASAILFVQMSACFQITADGCRYVQPAGHTLISARNGAYPASQVVGVLLQTAGV